MGIESQADRDFLVEELRSGELTAEQEDRVMDMIDQWDGAQAQQSEQNKPGPVGTQPQPAISADGIELGAIPENESTPLTPEQMQANQGSSVGEKIVGAANVAGTVLTGAIATPLSGLNGLLTLAAGGGLDKAVRNQEALAEAMTLAPHTEVAEEILQTVAEPLMYLDTQVKDFSHWASGGSPMAATAIYTGIMGTADIAGIKGARSLRGAPDVTIRKGLPGERQSLRNVPLLRSVDNAQSRVARVAKDLGVQLKQNDMAASVVRSAKESVPSERGASAVGYQTALKEAKAASEAQTAAKVARATERNAELRTSEIKQFSKNAMESLIDEGYDVQNMSHITNRLQELATIEKVSPITGKRAGVIDPEASSLIELPPTVIRDIAVQARQRTASLNEMQRIRDRASASMEGLQRASNVATERLPPSMRQQDALRFFQRKMDDFLDQQFTQDMVSGDPSAVLAWKQANAATRAHNARWNADKQIVKLMEMEASPTQISQFLIGSSSAGAKAPMLGTVRRMKELLGKDHPAMGAVATDFLHELMTPLLREPPNFTQFLRNHAETVRKHSPLMRELGLDNKRVKDLVAFAKVANSLGENTILSSFLSQLPATGARLWVGHGIAKAQVKVNLMTNVIKQAIGMDKVSRKEIIARALNVMEDTPVFKPGQVAGSRALEKAFWNDVSIEAPTDEDLEQ